MSPFLQFALALVIVITTAKLGGLLSLRLGQPSVLGELLAGLILGPSLLGFLDWSVFADPHLGEGIAHLAELGVLLLMFIAGLDLHLSDLAESSKVSVFAGSLGVLFPLGLGYGAMRLLGFGNETAIFTGLILAATSVSISAQTLMEMQVLRSRVGISLLGAAVFDDILVVLGLSIFIALTLEAVGGLASVTWIALRMLLFILAAIMVGFAVIPRLSRVVDKLPISQGLITFTFVMILFYSWSSEVLGGMAAITGAFLAGLVFSRSPLKERIATGISPLAYGVFVPIFFANVGLVTNARQITGDTLLLLVVLIAVAVLSKLLGGGLGGRLGGLTSLESLQLGAGLTSRGEVGLIVANIGIAEGVIGGDVFSVTVGVVIITTLLTPLMLRLLFGKRKGTGEER